MTARPRATTKRVRLRPQNPFDLIRLLARSQSDPRKAVAELVQNSLDAGAQHIEIDWFTDRGRRALRLWDDGEGIFPELERDDALRRIARTIGHSHKRDLTPVERREQMIQGKYGIGLIGFWSIGAVMEIKTRVAGGRVHVLRLREDRATGEVFPSRSRRVGEEETYTEITIRNVHEAAVNKIRPPRLQAFLANELRGQLLARGVAVRIHDRVARGRARKEFTVEPRPYLGLPLEDLRELEVPGFESARLELYLVAPDEERRGVVALACGGTVVLDDIAEIDGVDAPRSPWDVGQIEGLIDFPELYVAPGTRRGFAHDEPVAAFLLALEELERALVERLGEERRRRARRLRESLARDIRRAFRAVARRLPDYDFFDVRAREDGDERQDGAARGAPAAAGAGEPLPTSAKPSAPSPAGAEDAGPEDVLLFPPGPLARVEVRPRRLALPALATRSLRALGLDADGRPCEGDVGFTWRLDGPGELEADGPRATYTAPDLALALDVSGAIEIVASARQGESLCETVVPVRVTEAPADRSRVDGVPDPVPVSAPGEAWRSRVRDGRWEYNDAHRDYLAVADVDSKRLRYLIHLFAKEIVLRNFGRPGDAENLERMVEVLTWLEAGKGR